MNPLSPRRGEGGAKQLLSAAILVAADVLYRLPGLLHAHDVHSDAAVVALQAMHMLRGEFSRLLWGASYQGTLEPGITALFFAAGGPTPLMLALSALTGHLVVVLLGWRLLLRRLEPAKAFALSLVLVFTPQAINHMAWVPQPRIWCIALVFLAVFLIDLATPLALAAGMFVGLVSLWADLFAMQLMIPVLVFACLCIASRRHALALAAGLAAGIAAVVFLRTGTRVFAGPGGMSLSNVPKNATLLIENCLPMILGLQVWDPDRWEPPALWRAWQWLGAGVFTLSVAAAAPLALAKSRIPWELRRLGLLGAGTALLALVAFLPSGSPQDIWAARYLVGIVFFAPFALAPLAHALTLRGLSVAVLVPYLTVQAVSGLRAWGPKRFALPPAPHEEDELAAFLRARNVRYAAAPYWLAYRLTFLFQENPIVTPLDGARYKPWGESFEREEIVAYLVHQKQQPEVSLDDLLNRLQQLPGTTLEITRVAEYTVVLRHR